MTKKRKQFTELLKGEVPETAPADAKTAEEEAGLFWRRDRKTSSWKAEELPDDEDVLSDEDVKVVAGGFLFFFF